MSLPCALAQRKERPGLSGIHILYLFAICILNNGFLWNVGFAHAHEGTHNKGIMWSMVKENRF